MSRWHAVFGLLVLVLHAQLARAQDPVFQAAGFQQNRDYFTAEAGENIDTLSGNLVLTQTDLVLPGNAGRDLRFTRVYNGNRQLWTIDISGIPLRAHAAWPSVGAGVGVVPFMETGDLAIRFAYWTASPPLCANAILDACRYVMTRDFWLFDRETRRLYMPDGSINTYDAFDRIVSSVDPFGNTISFLWDTGLNRLVVTQSLGNQQAPRQVTVRFLPSGNLRWSPTALEYDGRAWQYDYVAPNLSQMTAATPPVGPGWSYGYTGELTSITTPRGGRVEFTYDNHTFSRDVGIDPTCQPVACSIVTRVVRTRSITAGGQPGVWTYVYEPYSDPEFRDRTLVTAPSGVVTEVYYKPTGLGSASMPTPEYQVGRRVVREGTTELEHEQRDYVLLPVSSHLIGMVPALQRVTLVRDGVTYRTTHEYRAVQSGDLHRPWRTTEEGNGALRTTTRDFEYAAFPPVVPGAPSIISKLKSETVQVGSQSAMRSWIYHPNGFRSSETLYGITTTFVNDGLGNVGTVRLANNHETGYSYLYGIISEIRTAEYTVTRTVNPEGTVASQTQGGRTTTFEYDNLFRIHITRPPGNVNPIVTDYDDAAGRTTVTRGASVTTQHTDGFGRPTLLANAAGAYTRSAYDAEGRMIFQGLPHSQPTGGPGVSMTYDGLGRVRRRDHTDGRFSTVTYGPGTISIVDEAGRTTVQTWAGVGSPADARLVSVRDAKQSTWNYQYNVLGKLTRVVAPVGSDRVWNYDAQNNLLLSESHPESGTVTYELYDSAGFLKRKRDARNTVFEYEYDGNDRPWQVRAGNKITTIGYEDGTDQRDSLATVVGGITQAGTIFRYDNGGRLANRIDTVSSQQLAQVFEYDGNDNLKTLTYADGRRVEYGYNAGNQVTQVTDVTTGAAYATDFQYHPTGAVTSYRTTNGVVHISELTPDRYLPSRIAAGPMELLYSNYDAAGNARRVQDARSAYTQDLEYDELDRLTYAASGNWVIRYDYHPNGDRLTNQQTSYTYEPSKRWLLSQGPVTFGYDPNGNMTSGLGTFTYTPDNLMSTSSALIGGVTSNASYAYDGDGWRVQKTTPTGSVVYLRGPEQQLLTEWDSLPAPLGSVKDYVYAGNKLIAVVRRVLSQ